MVYALPKGQIQITASRRPITSDDLLAARKNLATATAKLTVDQTALANAKTSLAQDRASSASAPQITADETAVTALEAAVLTDQRDAATAQATSDVLEKAPGRWIESASLTLLSPAPDPQHRYIANLSHAGLRDDNLTIGVNARGLLSSSQATSQDQTPAILANIAGGVAAVAGGIPGAIFNAPRISSFMEPQIRHTAYRCPAYELNRIFNPLDPDDIKVIKDALKESNMVLEVTPPPQTKPMVLPSQTDGLLYRTLVPVVVSIYPKPADQQANCKLENNPQAQVAVAYVPDTSTAAVISSQAGPFTTTSLTYTFTDGVLTQASFVRPSEVKGFADALVEIPKKIVSIPTDLIQLRVNYDTQAAALLGQKQAELQRQLDLLNAQKALDDARRQAATGANGLASTGAPTAPAPAPSP